MEIKNWAKRFRPTIFQSQIPCQFRGVFATSAAAPDLRNKRIKRNKGVCQFTGGAFFANFANFALMPPPMFQPFASGGFATATVAILATVAASVLGRVAEIAGIAVARFRVLRFQISADS